MFDNAIGKKRTINPQIDTQSWSKEAFKKAKDLVGQPKVNVWGYLITKSQYGETVNLVCSDQSFRKIPERYVAAFKAFSEEDAAYVMAGHELTVTESTTKKGDKTVLIRIGDYDM